VNPLLLLKRLEFSSVYGGWLKNKLLVSVSLFQLGQRALNTVFITEMGRQVAVVFYVAAMAGNCPRFS
jgi:hypothetical protein